MKVEWLDIRSITGSDVALVAASLPDRYARAQTFVHDADRLRSIGAGLLVLRLGLRAESDIDYGPHGKPSVAYLPAFNIAHSGNYVACAVADAGESAVGVDIERPREGNLRVADRVFTDAERAWMQEDRADQRFCQLWTCKEAVVKLFGEGLHMDPQGFDVLELMRDGVSVVNGVTLNARFETRDNYTLCAVTSE